MAVRGGGGGGHRKNFFSASRFQFVAIGPANFFKIGQEIMSLWQQGFCSSKGDNLIVMYYLCNRIPQS